MSVPSVFDMPATRIELHKTHTLFEEPARDQTLPSEIGRELIIQSIQILCLRVFFIEVYHLLGGRLHAVSEFVRIDSRCQFRLLRPLGKVFAVELVEEIQRLPLSPIAGS